SGGRRECRRGIRPAGHQPAVGIGNRRLELLDRRVRSIGGTAQQLEVRGDRRSDLRLEPLRSGCIWRLWLVALWRGTALQLPVGRRDPTALRRPTAVRVSHVSEGNAAVVVLLPLG